MTNKSYEEGVTMPSESQISGMTISGNGSGKRGLSSEMLRQQQMLEGLHEKELKKITGVCLGIGEEATNLNTSKAHADMVIARLNKTKGYLAWIYTQIEGKIDRIQTTQAGLAVEDDYKNVNNWHDAKPGEVIQDGYDRDQVRREDMTNEEALQRANDAIEGTA